MGLSNKKTTVDHKIMVSGQKQRRIPDQHELTQEDKKRGSRVKKYRQLFKFCLKEYRHGPLYFFF